MNRLEAKRNDAIRKKQHLINEEVELNRIILKCETTLRLHALEKELRDFKKIRNTFKITRPLNEKGYQEYRAHINACLEEVNFYYENKKF